MKNNFRKRMLSIGCAFTIMLSAAVLPFSGTYAKAAEVGSESVEEAVVPAAECPDETSNTEQELYHQSLELFPEGEGSEKTITLQGLMPEGASGVAVDVTEDYSQQDSPELSRQDSSISEQATNVVAAYNISILDGETEYQPDEERPILVEITDPGITADNASELWHIKDNGEREQITDFTAGDGMISFYATGFSVYAIVDAPEPFSPINELVESKDKLTGSRSDSGFYLFYRNSIYFENSTNSNSCFKETTNLSEAAVWYFETVKEGNDVFYKIYTIINKTKKYIHNKSGNLVELSETDADIFEIDESTIKLDNVTYNCFTLKKHNDTTDKWIQHSRDGGGIRYYTDKNSPVNTSIMAYYADKAIIQKDHYKLDGKTYGLMFYDRDVFGNAMMSSAKGSSALSVLETLTKVNPITHSGVNFISLDNDISMWTFHSVEKDIYTISTETDQGVKYLKLQGAKLTLTDAENASQIRAVPGSGDNLGRIKLSCENYAVSFEGTNGFKGASNNDTNRKLWLDFVIPSNLSREDYNIYSAEKISVSEANNGQSVIVYTRIWNDTNKRYDFYAIDHNGSLISVYERGDDIMWLGSKVNTLLWNFTEYYWQGTTTPNNYYELYNPYSKKYLAPQIKNGQILSVSKLGINMPGRRNGEYYSDIIAWDDTYYAYSGIKSNAAAGKIVSCPRSKAETFYFAVVTPSNDSLTTVETIDNNQFGIKMKMIDFSDTTSEQDDILGDHTKWEEHKTTAKEGILSTDLKANGYPLTSAENEASQKRSMSELYKSERLTTVNHLFLQSTYKASGYFEYDCCQNFATLKRADNSFDTDFIVYEQLGTTERDSKPTLRHGQFFPYDNITAGVFSARNPQNLYDSSANSLHESDPRKYEKLYTVGNDPDYNFGMELEASFVQTPSGRDAWGHDMIFEFTGDDDFWLYVDGELVIDLGGIHSALPGNVNFATGEVNVNGKITNLRDIFKANYKSRNAGASEAEINARLEKFFAWDPAANECEKVFKDYSPHSMKIFYMERGKGASNLHMRFNLSYVTPGNVMLTKNVTGTDDLDLELVQYPYQIWYRLNTTDSGETLKNEDGNFSVTYQNSSRKVEFKSTYTPPGTTEVYNNVYFLNPSQSAEVYFPDNTIEYRIIECGINTEVYDHVYVNGQEISRGNAGDNIHQKYDSGWVAVSDRPNIVFNNHVNPSGLRTLAFTKQLYDADNNLLTAQQDYTTFSFRLYLSNGVEDNLNLANMSKYYVVDPSGNYCSWDHNAQKFVSTGKKNLGSFTSEEKESITFETSMNGSISKIPAGYTVEVPNLPVGTHFKVEESENEVPLGYKFLSYTIQDGTCYPDGTAVNAGYVRKNESPSMTIKNKRGWGLSADKIWSDRDFTSDHASIYTAVYAKDQLVPGTIKKMTYPNTNVRYFLDNLAVGCTLSDYSVCEVELTDPIVADGRGNVVSYGTIKRLGNGDPTTIYTTSNGSAVSKPCSYDVYYQQGAVYGVADNVRSDKITNTRCGGIKITLYDMKTKLPLSGGVFTLYNGSTSLGTFVSDSNGRITVMYEFDRNVEYDLIETAAPEKYIGLPNSVTFKISSDDNLTLSGNEAQWQTWYKPKNAGDKLIAYIDLYNKQFALSAYKYDSFDRKMLSDAHFALYRGVTDNVNNCIIKDYSPMSGYEDLISDANGLIPEINNNLAPGTYYLSETTAPSGYTKLDTDIVFVITDRGSVSIVSTGHGTYLKTTGDDEIAYSIEIPNSLETEEEAVLTVTKTVQGVLGNKAEDFTFTLTVDGASASDQYRWSKNNVTQPAALLSGGTFTLKHGESVKISLPKDKNITITEANDSYETIFRLGSGASEITNSKTFSLSGDTELYVTNEKNGMLPTGIKTHIVISIVMVLCAFAGAAYVIRKKRTDRAE